MDDPSKLPSPLDALVTTIGSQVTSEDVDVFAKIRAVEDSSHRLRVVLSAWEKQQTEDRQQRKTFASWVLRALFAQMFFVNLAFLAIGWGWLDVDEWVGATFIAGVFAEIVGLAAIVLKYLFPDGGLDISKFLGD